MKVAVIGAGMAGLACAEALQARGCAVTLFDKGRRPGGRMSVRRLKTPLETASFDHGAQYFSASDPAFRAKVAQWAEAGTVARWTAAGHEAWVGTPAMNAPVVAAAARFDVKAAHRVETLSRQDERWRLTGENFDQGDFDALVVAVPAEQVASLTKTLDPPLAARAAATPSQPCWTVMAAFATLLPIAADVLRNRGAIAWAARNSAKPARSGPEAWVVQAGPEWSAAHLEEDRDAIARQLLDVFAQEANIALPAPIEVDAHRWRYARSGSAGSACLWNRTLMLGTCGDWLLGPRVEDAWLSGTALAAMMVDGSTPREASQAGFSARPKLRPASTRSEDTSTRRGGGLMR